jgi:hypothetical protein
MSSPLFIFERPSMPISLARSCKSFFDQGNYPFSVEASASLCALTASIS